MNYGDPADEGILKVLATRQIPTGRISDLGFGTARNMWELARGVPNPIVGYELNPDYLTEFIGYAEKDGIQAEFVHADVVHINFGHETHAMMLVSTIIYMPKHMCVELLQRCWNALVPNGILHVEVPLHGDYSQLSPFMEHTMFPAEDGYEASYWHHCWGWQCTHPGLYGASFWHVQEAVDMVKALGNCTIVAIHEKETQQNIFDDNDEPQVVTRRFCYITVVKE